MISPKGVKAGEIFSITLLLVLALVIVVPTALALIFKSETKQAKFEQQHRCYKEDLVQVNLEE